MSGVGQAYLLVAALAAATVTDEPAITVQAPDTPVRLDKAIVLKSSDAPPILVYSATNTTDGNLDQFTVIAFIFDARGTLKARQTAPARRTLEGHTTKFSTLVLDGSPLDATDRIVIGVNQAQKVGSELWWRADLQDLAVAVLRLAKP